jgi:hypothetical protein
MPTETINIPLTRILAGTSGTVLTGYNVLLLTATNFTGFYAGPISLPQWVDVKRPMRLFIRNQQANANAPAQAAVFDLQTVWQDGSGGNANQTDPFTMPVPQTGQGFLQTTEYVNDGAGVGPLYAAHLFPLETSVGWLIRRDGNTAGDTYPFTVSIATYLQLVAFRRCQFVGV